MPHSGTWRNFFNEEGDMEHATVTSVSRVGDETNRYNARSRSLQTAGILSLI